MTFFSRKRKAIDIFHPPHTHRLPRILAGTPLKIGDDILEINEVPIVDQDQQEVRVQSSMTFDP